jgi:hypothetical protein
VLGNALSHQRQADQAPHALHALLGAREAPGRGGGGGRPAAGARGGRRRRQAHRRRRRPGRGEGGGRAAAAAAGGRGARGGGAADDVILARAGRWGLRLPTAPLPTALGWTWEVRARGAGGRGGVARPARSDGLPLSEPARGGARAAPSCRRTGAMFSSGGSMSSSPLSGRHPRSAETLGARRFLPASCTFAAASGVGLMYICRNLRLLKYRLDRSRSLGTPYVSRKMLSPAIGGVGRGAATAAGPLASHVPRARLVWRQPRAWKAKHGGAADRCAARLRRGHPAVALALGHATCSPGAAVSAGTLGGRREIVNTRPLGQKGAR